MRAHVRSHQPWGLAAAALALLVLTVGTASAQVPSSTAYFFSSHPMISGTVVAVNDHQMVVATDQGEQVALEVDSRTMAPRDLAPGMVMRAEFQALEDCRFHAERILPIRAGMSPVRSQAYANSHDSPAAIARSGAAAGSYRVTETMAPTPATSHAYSSPPAVGRSTGASTTASPTTADYRFSTSPMISGRVVSVNDHRLVVETDQGQTVGMVMDSRTMLPGDVAPGSAVRTEFTRMGDGRYYARRISHIANGVAEREQAYAHTRDSDIAVAEISSDCGSVSSASSNTTTSALVRPEAVVESASAVAAREPAPVAGRPETLPQTASDQPLLLLLGLLALGSAGLVAVVRGHRMV